jgi:sec-independent protein translocase protein TatA
MSIGFWQIAIVVILVVLLFGRGKISGIMGDVAKGIKSFKKGMSSDVTDDKISSDITDDKISSDITDDNKPKNISEENKDTTSKE